MTDNTKMREEFEKWAEGEDMPITQWEIEKHKGEYWNDFTQSAWRAWQAAQMECLHSDSVPTRLPTDAAFRWLADNAVEPEATVQKLGKRLAEMLDEHHFSEVEALLIRILHAQSVPVVGEPVGFILIHENGGRNLTFHDNTDDLADGWSQHKLIIQPTTSITAQELERLRKDAERYRYLRKQHWSEAEICVVTNPKDAIKLGCYCPSSVRLDSAIDAAMQERQP